MSFNKKGDGAFTGFKVIYIIIFSFIVLAMGFVLLILINDYTASFLKFDPDLPDNIYAFRSINNCLAYQDTFTGRYFPGVIDFTKYNNNTLSECYSNTEYKSFNIQLMDKDQNIEHDRILVGFGGSLKVKPYAVIIRYENGSTSKGELYFGIS